MKAHKQMSGNPEDARIGCCCCLETCLTVGDDEGNMDLIGLDRLPKQSDFHREAHIARFKPNFKPLS